MALFSKENPISHVVTFEGSENDLVWRYRGTEELTATSQLIVDETHQAILVVNGQVADIFGAGRHTLSLPNIPLVKQIVKIPTGGETPFPCKVFYVSQVHQMDMLWGTRGAITLDDPIYGIFLHVMLHGSMTVSVVDPAKLLIKLAGFRDRMTAAEMIENFKGLVSSHVKSAISDMMINGIDGRKRSYFEINADLFEVSERVKSCLDGVFDEYGIWIEYFNIETIEVPPEDYEAISRAKERSSSRRIEGYSWQEERQMDVAERFAGNEGAMGGVAGAVGGFMMGGAFSGTVLDMTKSAMDPAARGAGAVPNGAPAEVTCAACGATLPAGSKFCNACGAKVEAALFCSQCGTRLPAGSKFCNACGAKI